MGRKPKEVIEQPRQKRKYTKRKKKRNVYIKSLSLEFNLRDEFEKKIYTILSEKEIVRRTIDVVSVYNYFFENKSFDKNPKEFSPLESELLKIVKYHAISGARSMPQIVAPGIRTINKKEKKEIPIQSNSFYSEPEKEENNIPVRKERKTEIIDSSDIESKLDALSDAGLK